MTAQPIEPVGVWGPDPVRQRLADYTLEDVLALPDGAPRVELRDVADSAEELVVKSPFDVRLALRDITP